MALTFPDVKEEPHFDKISFRVRTCIFATLNEKESRATIKLSEADQDLLCLYDASVIYPVPNKWGKHGWTNINLKAVPKEMCLDALKAAYEWVAVRHKKSSVKK